MIPRIRRQPPSEWPFWMLLAAWLCANIPQVAIVTVVAWMAEGRSFTHQQRLTQDVVRLLVGEKTTSPIMQIVDRAQESLPKKSPPPLPENAGMKKTELSLEMVSEVLPPALRSDRPIVVAWSCPDARRSQPPHGPPRLTTL